MRWRMQLWAGTEDTNHPLLCVAPPGHLQGAAPSGLILGKESLPGCNQIQAGVYIYMVSCPCSVLGGKRLHYHKEYVFIPLHKYYLL